MNIIINKLCSKKAYFSQVNHQLKKILFAATPVHFFTTQNVSNETDYNKSQLSQDLFLKIKMSGPISVANYMKHVLTHPVKGYYTNRNEYGVEGDFVTSPELSQLFGEMIALWIVNEYRKIYDKHLQLVELGPGTGILSRDILRIFHQLDMSDKVSLHLVEVSPALSNIQEKMLCASKPEENDDQNSPPGKYYKKRRTVNNVNVFWYKSILDIPQDFSVFIAHEFFDALPIYKFQKTNDGWFEVLVDIDSNSKTKDKLRFVLSKTEACDTILNKNDERDHVEISLESMNIIRYISAAITQNGGFSLIIDYGHYGDNSDTFRAFRQHEQCDPLLEPGTADLTANVDFALLKKVALEKNKLLFFGPVTQHNFLMDLGINYRLKKLCEKATEKQRKQLEYGYSKIMDPEDMGTCFKVVSMFPYVLKDYFKILPVIGFENFIIQH